MRCRRRNCSRFANRGRCHLLQMPVVRRCSQRCCSFATKRGAPAARQAAAAVVAAAAAGFSMTATAMLVMSSLAVAAVTAEAVAARVGADVSAAVEYLATLRGPLFSSAIAGRRTRVSRKTYCQVYVFGALESTKQYKQSTSKTITSHHKQAHYISPRPWNCEAVMNYASCNSISRSLQPELPDSV